MKRSPTLSDKPQALAWLRQNPQGAELFEMTRRLLTASYRGENHGYINLGRYVEYRFNGHGDDYTTILARLSKALVTFHLAEGPQVFEIEHEEDLKKLAAFLSVATVANFDPVNSTESLPPEEDEAGLLDEDLRKLRDHKRLERDSRIARKVKEALGYRCMACKLDFSAKYGPLGAGYIEAHHLTPAATTKGMIVRRDPKKDFAVLCSNCHRMIHKTPLVGDVNAFRKLHVRSNEA
jgi:hypothetical protein